MIEYPLTPRYNFKSHLHPTKVLKDFNLNICISLSVIFVPWSWEKLDLNPMQSTNIATQVLCSAKKELVLSHNLKFPYLIIFAIWSLQTPVLVRYRADVKPAGASCTVQVQTMFKYRADIQPARASCTVQVQTMLKYRADV